MASNHEKVYVDGKIAGIIIKRDGKVLAMTEMNVQLGGNPAAWVEHPSRRKAIKALEKWGEEHPDFLGRVR